MSDLIQRLRYWSEQHARTDCGEAADVIQQLRGELSLAEEGLTNATQENADLRALLSRARSDFIEHLCIAGKPFGSDQDPTITCLRCEIDSVLHPKTD